jgi:hypothetical protein
MKKTAIRKMLIAQGMGWMLDAQRRPIWTGRLRSKEHNVAVKGAPISVPQWGARR